MTTNPISVLVVLFIIGLTCYWLGWHEGVRHTKAAIKPEPTISGVTYSGIPLTQVGEAWRLPDGQIIAIKRGNRD